MLSFQAAFGPPRPCAIGTIMMSDDNETSLSSIQTLLYSIKAHLRANNTTQKSDSGYYQPEIVTLVTPNISNETCKDIACFCTRVIRIKDTIDGDDDMGGEMMKMDSEEASMDSSIIARIQILSQTVYDQFLYIDSRCLVQKDISHLFNTQYSQNKSLLGLVTAPAKATESQSEEIGNIDNDSCNADDFDTSVMLIRPCHKMYIDMKKQAKSMNTIAMNQNVHTFWNAYFRTTWTCLPAAERLDDEYNYSTVAVSNHEAKEKKQHISIWNNHGLNDPNPGIEQLYQKWHNKSRLFKENYDEGQKLAHKAKHDSKIQQEKKKLQQQGTSTDPNNSKTKQMEKHKLVSKRYKKLRKEGKSTKEAMAIARSDYGMDKDEERQQSPSTQVAAMFGMGGMI